MPNDTCRPGGCDSLGCEGGHYCYNADGSPKPSASIPDSVNLFLEKVKDEGLPSPEVKAHIDDQTLHVTVTMQPTGVRHIDEAMMRLASNNETQNEVE